MNKYNVRNYFVKEVGRVDRKFAWNRVGQLPVAMFGIIHRSSQQREKSVHFWKLDIQTKLRNAAPTLTSLTREL